MALKTWITVGKGESDTQRCEGLVVLHMSSPTIGISIRAARHLAEQILIAIAQLEQEENVTETD